MVRATSRTSAEGLGKNGEEVNTKTKTGINKTQT